MKRPVSFRPSTSSSSTGLTCLLVSPRLPSADILAIGRTTPTVLVGGPFERATSTRSPMTTMPAGSWPSGHLVGARPHPDRAYRRRRGAGSSAREPATSVRCRGLGLEPQVVSAEFTEVAGVSAAERLIASEDLPTAIFAANDLVAAGAMDRLEDEGLRIPGRRLDHRLRQHLPRRAAPHVADDDRPAAARAGRLALSTLVERVDGDRAAPLSTSSSSHRSSFARRRARPGRVLRRAERRRGRGTSDAATQPSRNETAKLGTVAPMPQSGGFEVAHGIDPPRGAGRVEPLVEREAGEPGGDRPDAPAARRRRGSRLVVRRRRAASRRAAREERHEERAEQAAGTSGR